MTMSTQTLTESARLLASVLIDTVQVFDVAEPVTEGIHVTRALTPVGEPVAGLVQSQGPLDAVEGRTDTQYSVKVPRTAVLRSGQAVRVLSCQAEPDLVGVTLLVGKVSSNGLSMIHKGVATLSEQIQQQGKEVL